MYPSGKVMLEIKIGDEDFYFHAGTEYVRGDLPTDIDEFIEFFIKSKKDGASHIKLNDTEGGDGVDGMEFHPIFMRKETNLEFQIRKDKHDSDIVDKENEEKEKRRAVYETLKLEFDD